MLKYFSTSTPPLVSISKYCCYYVLRTQNSFYKFPGIALHDSPVGLAAYLLDRVMIFTDPANKLTEDGGLFFPDPTRTDTYKYYNNTAILDNVMLYWSTGSITTAMRLYKETIRSSDLEQDLAK